MFWLNKINTVENIKCITDRNVAAELIAKAVMNALLILFYFIQ